MYYKKLEELGAFEELKNSNHWLSPDKPNPWHLECKGNVFGHTEMVYKNAKKMYPDDKILHISALLHDIGKPICRDIKDDKVRFFSHESMGVFIALEYLKKLDISKPDILRVLKLIQRHADPYKFSGKKIKALYEHDDFVDVMKIRKCDALGRISNDPSIEDFSIPDLVPHNISSNDKPIITLLIGPPCSGKSTFSSNDTVLSRDECVMKLATSDDYSKAWNEVNQKEVDELFQSKKKALYDEGNNFTIDMTNMKIKSRKRFLQNKKFNYHAVVFLTSYTELLKRNKERKNKCLQEYVIENMCKTFQFPFYKEGFSKISYIIN